MKVERKKNLSINEVVRGLGNSSVKVGWFEDAVYPNGTPVAVAASAAEFGTRTAPPRPILRSTIEENKKKWAAVLKRGYSAELGGASADTLEAFGLVVQGDIQATIASITSPALSESTVKNRLRKLADGKTVGNLTKPLVETGYMLASVRSIVD